MAEDTKIEWADHTFNPWAGCTKLSDACANCYAEKLVNRFGGDFTTRRRTSAANWSMPLRWNARAMKQGIRYRVFCASLADVFDNQVPEEWRADLWNLIRSTTHLDWLLLTKRPQNIAAMLPSDWGDGYPHVWLGTTVENQTEADRRIPHLLAVPAAVRFLSMEPLLGPVNLNSIKAPRYPDEPVDDLDIDWRFDCLTTGDHYWFDGENGQPGDSGDGPYREHRIDWVIAGGESGPGARPMHPVWVRAIRDQCTQATLHGDEAPVPFFFKQWGEWLPSTGETGFEAGCKVTTKRSFTTQQIGTDLHAVRVGKKAAGRLLYGRTWDQLPKAGAT